MLFRSLKVNGGQLVFGNGSDELIIMALRAFTNPASNVIVGFPTFLIYEIQSIVTGVEVRRVGVKSDRYNLDGMASCVDKNTSIIFIANPDNPFGSYLTHNEIHKFLAKIPSNILVFLDEAYFEFVTEKDFPRSFLFLKERGNIIISRTFSKAYGLAGLRIGYGITTLDIARVMNKVREPFNINRFAQVAAVSALKNKSFLKKVLSYIKEEKLFLYRNLDHLGINYTRSSTNFILVKLPQKAENFYDFLLTKGVIVRDMSGWGLDNLFRVTIGLHKENKVFLNYLASYLRRK